MNLDNILTIQATEDGQLTSSHDKARRKKFSQEYRIAIISDEAVENKSIGLD